MKRKGQTSAVLMMLLPFILIAIFVLLSAAVVSMLKLPIALVASVALFFFGIPYLKSYLDLERKYAMLGMGIISALTFYVIYNMNFFVLILAVFGLFVVSIGLDNLVGINPIEEGMKMMEEEEK